MRPRPRYRILGLALVAGWNEGYFFLEGFSASGTSRGKGPLAEIEQLTEAKRASQPRAALSALLACWMRASGLLLRSYDVEGSLRFEAHS